MTPLPCEAEKIKEWGDFHWKVGYHSSEFHVKFHLKKLACVVSASLIKLTWNTCTLIRLGISLQNSLCSFRVFAILLKHTIVLQSTVTLKLVIATGMATCCSTSQLTSLSTTLVMMAEETWYGRMQLWRARGMNALNTCHTLVTQF